MPDAAALALLGACVAVTGGWLWLLERRYARLADRFDEAFAREQARTEVRPPAA